MRPSRRGSMKMADAPVGGKTSRSAFQPQEIASGVYCLEVGKGITPSNIYYVRSGSSWVLIDTASAHCEREIEEAATTLFGAHTPPAAILLTHDHLDHAGSTQALAQTWGCWAYVHPNEWPLVSMDPSTYLSTVKQYANPLDRWLILPILRLTPAKQRAAMLAQSSFKEVAHALDLSAGVPGQPGWDCIPTPGQIPGHVFYFRPADGGISRGGCCGDGAVELPVGSPPVVAGTQ
jgi:glyoxylase-like metal-dependent hydrolase (beta-lactamase superfamily II)